MNGVDVARDAANIILLEKDLAVLDAGIREGRSSFANIMKYIVMGTSSNFGNMFSMAGASLFLPFLPMLPTQILLNNLLYDTSQMAIPTRPRRPRAHAPTEALEDRLHPAVHAHHRAHQLDLRLPDVRHPAAASSTPTEQLFHTGWFVESLATQTLVVFVIRTAGNPLRSRPSRTLTIAVLTVVLVGFALPYTPVGTLLGFVPMPWQLIAIIVFFAATYLGLVQLVKTWFYRRHELI